ncbi:hypothetical protein [Bradyrhizobium ottawaense]|uniref:hypothetical protein n=1 Tax=Bradyrhizobium ottawaense TaxID=931866 RepID=UPI00103DB5AA|nr:hypothetical protein [Bradyrhizobium ottawaense]
MPLSQIYVICWRDIPVGGSRQNDLSERTNVRATAGGNISRYGWRGGVGLFRQQLPFDNKEGCFLAVPSQITYESTLTTAPCAQVLKTASPRSLFQIYNHNL